MEAEEAVRQEEKRLRRKLFYDAAATIIGSLLGTFLLGIPAWIAWLWVRR